MDEALLARLSVDQLNTLTRKIVLGAPQPPELSADERAAWDALAAEIAANPGLAYSPLADD